MGHVRLGTLPRSKAWKEVVGLITAGADAAQVANATLGAAEKAFSQVLRDPGYREAVWIMTQLAIAPKTLDHLAHLNSLGINITSNSTLPEVASAISDAIDKKIESSSTSSDFSEIARRALVSAVTGHLKPKLPSLFPEPKANDVRRALASLAKSKEFGILSQSFFTNMARESLNYFLSKNLNTQLGENQRFATMNQKALFDRELHIHCSQASVIVRDFSKDWFSKHRYEEGGNISRNSSNGFAAYSLQKMKSELKAGANYGAE